MTAQEILKLIDAGFTADEIRQLNGVAAASAPDPAPAPDPEPAPAPDPDPDPAPDPAPAPAQPAAPSWFEEFVQKNNEEMARLQRALQVQNVRRAATPPAGKTPEQLMAEAYHAIVD